MIGNEPFNIWLFDIAIGFFNMLISVGAWFLSPIEIVGVTLPISPFSLMFGIGLLVYLAKIVVKFFIS